MNCEKCGSLLVNGKCPNCDVETELKKKGKNRNMAIFAVILSVISIGLLVGGFYMLSSPKTIVLQSISNWSKLLKEGTSSKESKFLEKIASHDQVQLKENISFKADPMLELGFENMNINLLYNDDFKNKKSNTNLQFLLDQNELDIDSFLANDKFYLNIKDIFDKYYYMDMEYTSLIHDANKADSEKFIDIVFDAFKKEVNDQEFKKSKETISLGDKTKKTTKISYTVTYKKLYQVGINILNAIKEDKELMALMSNGQSEKEVKEQIDQLISIMESGKKEKETVLFDYNVYYYGFNNIVMEEFDLEGTALQYYHYDQVDEIKVLDLASKNSYFTMKMEETKNETKISGFILTYPYQGSYVKKENSTTLKLSFDVGDGDQLTLDLEGKVEEDDNHYKEEMNLAIGGTDSGTRLDKVMELSLNMEYSFDQKMDTSVLDGATSFDAMTEEEQIKILEALETHPLLSSIFGKLYEIEGDDDYELDLDDYDSDRNSIDLEDVGV